MEFEKLEFEAISGFKSYQIRRKDNLIIAVVTGLSNNENLKNATLFESAPEMFEMLKDLLSMYTNTDKPSVRLILNAKQLLTKITEL